MCALKPIGPLVFVAVVFLIRNLFSRPKDVTEAAYKGIVRPILEYGSSVWGPHYEGLIDDLEKLEKRAARITCIHMKNVVWLTSLKLKWESLQKRRK